MKSSTNSIIKGAKATTYWIGRVLYYYLILLALFLLYFVQKQQTAAPYIYNNF